MVAQKRKAVTKSDDFSAPLVEVFPSKGGKDATVEEVKPLKRKVAALKAEKVDKSAAEAEIQDAPMTQSKLEEEAVSPEKNLAHEEEEVTAARTKELKAMAVDQVKELVLSKGLEIGKKDEMIDSVVSQEAAERSQIRERAAKTRAAVSSKKEELEALSAPELKDLCAAKGISGASSKPERVEELLKQWLEDGGVDKMLAKAAHDAREAMFMAKDKETLRTLCSQAVVDPFVKEIIVDRIVQSEVAAGCFARPSFQSLDVVFEEEQVSKGKTVDMVDAVLVMEATRKQEMEAKRQQEEAEANKKKELKAMSLDELKKRLGSKKLQVVGKKDDMVDALFANFMQETAADAKKNRLKALDINVLNKLVVKRGLKIGKRDEMVDSLLLHEAQGCEAARCFAVKIQEINAKRKAELASKTGVELKELCISKGLKAGVGADDRVERLLEQAKIDGELDRIVTVQNRTVRREELSAMNLESLQKLCVEKRVNPLVKEIMVERLLAHEAEFGLIKVDGCEPSAKKARKTR